MNWKIRAMALLTALMLLMGIPALANEAEPIVGYDSTHPENLEPDHLYAQAAILIDYETGQTLFEKNADREMSPASTTKIMTCLLALEHFGDNLDQYITVPAEAADIPDGSSRVPVTVGEQMTVRDLLFGMMLHSGNDAANAVAALVAGSLDQFVKMMNDRAAQLGCEHTHFVNAHGYTAEGHYTSARDMAKIAREAMGNDTFRGIVRTMKYTMLASNARGAKLLTNTNLWGASTGMYKYKYGNGIKTGFTSAAGQCLVGSATNEDGVTLISVVFRSTTNTVEAKWQDSTKLMEYGYTRYTRYAFDQIYEMAPITVQVENASQEDEAGGQLTLKAIRNNAANPSAVLLDVNLPGYLQQFKEACHVEYGEDALKAPIEENSIVGNLTYTDPDGTVVTALLTAERSVEAARSSTSTAIHKFFESTPGWLLTAIVVLFVLWFIVWRISAAVKKREKRRRQIERARRRALREKQLQKQNRK